MGQSALQRPAAVLRDRAADQALVDAGYTRFPLFDPARLLALWDDHREQVGDEDGITFDTIRPDRSALRRTTAAAAPLWAEVVDDAFADHEVVFTAFVVKYPGDFSGMAPHDDRTFVDERTTRSITVWVPLVDCGPEQDNGWIGVIPGSHRTAPGFGGTGIADWFAPYRDVLADHLTPVQARAGEAVVWDSRIIHGSPPNRSDQPRPVLVAALAPRGAELVHVRGTGRRHRRVYAVDAAFHLDHSPLSIARHMPDYPVIDEVDDPDPTVSAAVIQALCGLDGPPSPMTERPADDRLGDGSGRCELGPLVANPDADDIARRLSVQADVWISELDPQPLDAMASTDPVPLVRGGPSPVARALLPDGAESLAEAAAPHPVDLVVLAPGTSTMATGGTDILAVLPLAMPTGSAGIAWVDGALPFESGIVVAPPAGGNVQLWNDGRDPLPVLAVRPASAPGPVDAAFPAATPARRRRLFDRLLARSG